MESSVIFNELILLILLGLALFLSVFDMKKRASGYILPLLSILITLCTLAYAILLGATLYETATVLMLFAAVNLLSYGAPKGGKA